MADVRIQVRTPVEELDTLKKAFPEKIGHLQTGADLLRWAVAEYVGERQTFSINRDKFKRIRQRPRVTGKVVTLLTVLDSGALDELLTMVPAEYRSMHSQAVRWTIVEGLMGLQGEAAHKQMLKVSRGRRTGHLIHGGSRDGQKPSDLQKKRRGVQKLD